MATDQISSNLPLEVSATIAQLRRDNERLHNRVQQLDEEAHALLVLQEVAQTLSAELRPTVLLRRIAIAALRLTAGQVSIAYLLDAKRGALIVEATETAASAVESSPFGAFDPAANSEPGASSEESKEESKAERAEIALNEGVAGHVATTGMLVLIADPAHDHRFTAQTIALDGKLLGVQPTSLVAVPMVFNDAVIGVLEVAQKEAGTGFDARNLDLMRTLAAQAAIAIANARLYHRLRRERDRIIRAQEDERKRLGRELHDGPAQKLSQIAMSLDFAEQLVTREPQRLPQELRAVRELAQSTSRDLRNLLFDLRPLMLDAENGGLVAALSHFFERFHNTASPQMHLSADYPERLSHNIELTVFAIVQEAVNNILKHANAHNCWIDIREYPDKLVVTMRDDGQGFDVKQVQSEYEHRGSWGLLGMLERAILIDGRFNIASQPGKGTIASLEVPR